MSSKQYFEVVAKKWDNMAESFFGEAPKDAILSKTNSESVDIVADLGCGSGYLTEAFITRSKKIYCVDQSQSMLEIIENKFGANIETRLGQGSTLPLEDSSVDLAIANMFMHHVEHPEVTISEVYRALKAGGQFVFTDLDTHDNEFLVTEQHDRWMGFDRNVITLWMEAAGFTNVNIESVGSNCCASSGCGDQKAEINIFIASGEKA